MKLLIIENADQDRFGIDTVIMVVPKYFHKEGALKESSLERPKLVEIIPLDDFDHAPLINLGEYRAFIG